MIKNKMKKLRIKKRKKGMTKLFLKNRRKDYNIINKDRQFRKSYLLKEDKQLFLKFCQKENYLNNKIKKVCSIILSQNKQGFAKNKVKNLCILTGKARNINRKFKLCGIEFKRLANLAILPSVRKWNN